MMDDNTQYRSPVPPTPPPMPPPYPQANPHPWQPAPPPGGFGKAVSTCFRKFAVFSGRATRPEFWWWQLFQFIVNFAVSMVGGIAVGVLTFQTATQGGEPNPLVVLIPQAATWLVQLVFLLPNWAVSCRRLHDTGRSGWWLAAPLGCLLVTIPAVAGIGFSVAARDEGNVVPLAVGCGALMVAAVIAAMVFGILLLVWFCSPTQPGPNRYGPQPPPF